MNCGEKKNFYYMNDDREKRAIVIPTHGEKIQGGSRSLMWQVPPSPFVRSREAFLLLGRIKSEIPRNVPCVGNLEICRSVGLLLRAERC